MTITVYLVDDQAMVRAGIKMILEAQPDLDVVGEAVDGAIAVVGIEHLQPDVVLMDIQMPVMDGLEATRRIAAAGSNLKSRVLILTTFERDEYVFEALRAGASGFLLKNAPPEDLVSAVRVVAHGNGLLSPSVTRRIIEEFASRPAGVRRSAELEQLTEREVEVLRLLAQGMNNEEIAHDLTITPGTTKTHVSNLLGKLGLRDRTQAVVFAYESGLVSAGAS